MNTIKTFLKKKNIEFTAKRYFITALSYMTYGLFASLIIGSILNQVGLKLNIPLLYETIWPVAKAMTGPAIAVAVLENDISKIGSKQRLAEPRHLPC